MTVMLSFEHSVQYLEGHWPAYLVELTVVEDLRRRNVTEPTVVVLADGAVAFYVAGGEVV